MKSTTPVGAAASIWERLSFSLMMTRRWQQMLLNPVRDGLGIAQAVRVVRVAVLDHHCDAAAQLLITILNGQRVALEQKIGAAKNVQ
jgi:hypothetical protein